MAPPRRVRQPDETSRKRQLKILIEVFAAPGCSTCAQMCQALRAVAEQLGAARFDWYDLDLLENIGRAVVIGVMSPPSLAIDAELVLEASAGGVREPRTP